MPRDKRVGRIERTRKGRRRVGKTEKGERGGGRGEDGLEGGGSECARPGLREPELVTPPISNSAVTSVKTE